MAKLKNNVAPVGEYGFASSLNTSGLCRKAMGSYEYLKLLENFEGRIYDETIALEMYIMIISSRISVPDNAVFKEYKADINGIYSNEDIYNLLLRIYETDKGVKKNAINRVKSYFIGHNRLGFCVVERGKVLKLTKTGRMIVNSLKEDNDSSLVTRRGVLLNALVKYPQNAFDFDNKQRRKMENKKVLLPFILAVLKQVDYISTRDIPIISGWYNSNVDACAKVILERRKEETYSKSSSILFIMDLADMDSNSVFKFTKTKREESEKNIIDAFTRNWYDFFENTGLVKVEKERKSVRLYLNKAEIPLIDYVIANYLEKASEYQSYEEQIDNLLELDSYFFNKSVEDMTVSEKLKYKAENLSLDEIKLGIESAVKGKNSDPATYFEYYLALFIQKYCTKDIIVPGFSVTKDGDALYHAGSGKFDFVVENYKRNMYVEVTLISDDSGQTNRELDSITRHATKAAKEQGEKERPFMLFIAPKIGEMMLEYIQVYNNRKKGCPIIPLTVDDLYSFFDSLKHLGEKLTVDDIYTLKCFD